MGFLSPRPERNCGRAPENSQDRLMNDYTALCLLFPEFPKQMLLVLVLREEGRSLDVALFLKDRGWGSSTDHSGQFSALSTSNSPQFTTPHFWGLVRPCSATMRQFVPGSFFTILKVPNEFYLVFLDSEELLVERHIEGPKLTDTDIRMFCLRNKCCQSSRYSGPFNAGLLAN